MANSQPIPNRFQRPCPRERVRIRAGGALPARSPVSPFDQQQPFRAENLISRRTGIVRRGNPTERAYCGPGAVLARGPRTVIRTQRKESLVFLRGAHPPASRGHFVARFFAGCKGKATPLRALAPGKKTRSARRRGRGGGGVVAPLAGPGFRVSSLVCFVGCVMVGLSCVPSASSVVLFARCALAPWSGSALGVSFRPSSRALSGVVAVVRFASAPVASAFARSWSRRLPVACRGCVVRAVPVVAGVAPSWVVSVPVAPPPVPVRRGGASRRLAAVVAARCSVAA